MLKWSLEKNEDLLWQGRPAPRCYLMRHWRGQIVCIVALVVSVFMFVQAIRHDFSAITIILLLLLVLLFLAAGPVRLILLRLRWETVFYAVTDRRLLIQCGGEQQTTSYPLANLQTIATRSYTEHLADIQLTFMDSSAIVLECLEEPDTCLRALPASQKVT